MDRCLRPAAAFCLVALASAQSLPWLSVRAVNRALNPNSTRSHVIVDDYGREVMLHGVCVENEARTYDPHQRPLDPVLYSNGSCPLNYAYYDEPPICQVDYGKGRYTSNSSDTAQNDFAQIRALGLNIIRLCLSWSDLEPTPGVYSPTYIARVQQIVSWAKEQGVYVILDMHEDLYSLYIQPDNTTGPGIPGILTPGGGQDGAPAWAVAADGWPALNPFGIAQINLKVSAAFQSFYDNVAVPGIPQGSAPGPGLQDHFIGGLAALLTPFLNESTVAGLELLNEPLLGLDLDPIAQATTLYGFYRRAVQALTGVRDGLPTCPPGTPGNMSGITCAYPDLGLHTRHLIFAEPCALRNTLDFSLMDPVPWTNYTNIVHTPHVYTHVFTADQEIPGLFPNKTIPNPDGPGNISTWSYPPSWDLAYTSAWNESAPMNSAVFVTEFGAGMHEDSYLVEPNMAAAERSMTTGWTLWSWKSNCNWGVQCANESWTVYAPAPQNAYPNPIPANASLPQNGALSADRERILGKTMVRACVGELLSFHFNTSWPSDSIVSASSGGEAARSFYMFANSTGGGGGGSRQVDKAQQAELERYKDLLCERSSESVESSTHCVFSNSKLLALAADTAHDNNPSGQKLLDAFNKLLASNGSVTEVYIPRSVPAQYVPAVVASNPAIATIQNVVTWPDGSRSVYVAITGAGVYGVTVGPAPVLQGAACVRWPVGSHDACAVVEGRQSASELVYLLQSDLQEQGLKDDALYLQRTQKRQSVEPAQVVEAYSALLHRAKGMRPQRR